MQAESQFLSFQGLRVHFRIVEPETELKHRLLVISSPLTSTFNWRKIVPELAQLGCLMVLMDLPGFGESDCQTAIPHSNEVRAHLAWGVLDELDRAMDEKLSLWHLMAHGSSCQTILTMGNQYPDSVRSQIHISPEFVPMSAIRTAGLPSAKRAGIDKWYARNIASTIGFQRYTEQIFARPPVDYVAERMRNCLTRPGVRENFFHAFRTNEALEPCKGFSPIMALWGGRDTLIDQSARSAISQLIPEAEKHVLKTAGHIPMETHSKALRDYLRGWLRYVE